MSDDEVRLVAMTRADADALGMGLSPRCDRLAASWENGITEEEAEDLYRIAAVYRKVEAPSGDALRKLRSAFQPPSKDQAP